MDDGGFGIGMFFGSVMVFIIMLVFLHIDESHCQAKHNVADCKQIFVPVVQIK